MDRFIVFQKYLRKFTTANLKSNMDRFIDNFLLTVAGGGTRFKIQYGQIYSFYYENGCSIIPNLKSNMDRFIGKTTPIRSINELDLKSNMDRFIVDKKQADYNVIIFKIQYGQIYSES